MVRRPGRFVLVPNVEKNDVLSRGHPGHPEALLDDSNEATPLSDSKLVLRLPDKQKNLVKSTYRGRYHSLKKKISRRRVYPE